MGFPLRRTPDRGFAEGPPSESEVPRQAERTQST